jgi:hypothetical protein
MMDQKAKARMRRECKEYLEPFGLPLDKYNAGEIEGGPYVFDVRFKHKVTDAEILVSQVWTSDDGTVNQVGSHYGALEF